MPNNVVQSTGMSRDKALKLAIQALESQRRLCAFDANLAECYGSTDAAHVGARKRREEIDEALKTLRGLLPKAKEESTSNQTESEGIYDIRIR